VSETELSVVCKNCGSEVSPYVTECPYCGARLRKRAPKLERKGDGLEAKQPRRRSRDAKRRGSRPRRRRRLDLSDDFVTKPYVTAGLIIASAVMVVVFAATDLSAYDLGAVVGSVDSEFWRYLTASFVYLDTGYLFVVALALALFGPGVERRLGTLPTLLLLLACGALGMLAADGVESALDNFPLAAGGNGIALGALAAWFALRRAEAAGGDHDYDRIGVAVAAVVLLALPIFEDTANVITGLAGGLVGGLAGLAATGFGRRE
jgi:membrane associated rhomboid family serine protease